MKIQPYIHKLNNSDQYQDFMKQNKDAFMIAGFFVLDFESGQNIHQIDYYVPKKKKIAAFTLDHGVTMQMMDLLNEKVPEKLDITTKIDLEALYGILEDEMKNRGITEDIKKIIAVLQNIEGKKIWNLSCILSGMSILRAHVEDESKSVLKMDRANMIDIIKKVSPDQFKGMLEKQGVSEKEKEVKPSKKDIDAKMKQLNDLEAQIEKQKEALQNQLTKEKSPASVNASAKKAKK